MHFISRTPRSLEVKTPFVNAAIEGTEFVLRVQPRESTITVFEGQVAFANSLGSLQLASGESAIAPSGKPPQKRIVVRPRDAVQWALYYPPLIDYRVASQFSAPTDLIIKRALESFRDNDLTAAFAYLDSVPENQRNADFFSLKAGILLTVGRVPEAQASIGRALTLDPRQASAYALQSVIALVNNDREAALQLSSDALVLDPQSSLVRIARSYALQGSFDIEGALQATQKAVDLAPNDALAWARLAELELSLGNLDRSLAAAQRAVALDPSLSRTQIVLGFAYLARIDMDSAWPVFEKAIQLDPAAPLARVGLGLTRIRAGELDAGVAELEVAAILDPNNALIRSYLGKGYYEQKRERLAATEFATAKQLDPSDPTPFMYSAVLKQTTNRPIEALRDLQKSKALNDNRAVFRSRLLLDRDLAARSARLGRVFTDLGFEHLALLEGWKALNTDPGNHSAHRLLSDSYARLRRHELARSSELLQAQLLQPLNITPVQPQVPFSNDLLLLNQTGITSPSLNEFNPLFARNQLALQASGVVGNNNTIGDEVIFSGLENRFSFSLGQFRHETDGFRENNDTNQDALNAFAQFFVSPKLSIQGEFNYLNTNSGDTRLRFDGFVAPNLERRLRRAYGRFGFAYRPSPNDDVIGSFFYRDIDDEYKNSFRQSTVIPDGTPIGIPGPVTFGLIDDTRDTSDIQGYSAELQYISRHDLFNLVIGAGHSDQDREDSSVERTTVIGPGGNVLTAQEIALGLAALGLPPSTLLPLNKTASRDIDPRYSTGYVYGNVELHDRRLMLTLGFSLDAYDSRDVDYTRLNPKLGLIYKPSDRTTARLGLMKGIHPPFANQTIEPTQVAGFNQLFDDPNGTRTSRYGLALEHEWSDNLYGGVEATWRDLDVQVFVANSGRTITEDQDEHLHRAYLYATPTDRLAATAEYFYEKSDVESFRDVETHRVPFSLSYFHPNGFFAKLAASRVHQDVSTFALNDKESFWIADAGVGLRLPKRLGILTAGVHNIFDENFLFEDVNYNSGDPINPIFVPDRTYFATISLSFSN